MDTNNSTTNEEKNKDSKNKKEQEKSQALITLEMIENEWHQNRIKLFTHPLHGVHAQVEINGCTQVLKVNDKGPFFDWVRRLYRQKYKNLVSANSVKEAIDYLKGEVESRNNVEEIYVRVAGYNGEIYIDMCNKDRQFIKITKNGWEIVNHAPVNFIRPDIAKELPIPTRNGSIDDLKKLINYRNEDEFKLIIGWILAAFSPDGPFPILNMQGGPGSAKTSTTRVIRSIVDPSAIDVRRLTMSERDVAIATINTWIPSYDNLSGMPSKMSDIFCCLSTGGVLALRKLYSDTEEIGIEIQRPVIFNGINDIAKRQDLLSRSIIINLPKLQKTEPERTMKKMYEELMPGILGALLDVVSGGIKELPDTKINKDVRLADFVQWITACENTLGWQKDSFIDIFLKNRIIGTEQGIGSDPVAICTFKFMEDKDHWSGRPIDFMKVIETFDEYKMADKDAQTSYLKVRSRLRGIKGALEDNGLIFNEPTTRTNKGSIFELTKITDSNDNDSMTF